MTDVVEKIPVYDSEEGTRVEKKVLYDLLKREFDKIIAAFNASFESMRTREEKNVLKTAQMLALAAMIGEGRAAVDGEDMVAMLDAAMAPLIAKGKLGIPDTFALMEDPTPATPQEVVQATREEGKA